MSSTNLQFMLTSLLGAEHASQLSDLLQIPASTLRPRSDTVSRIEIAQALNMLLFEKLLKAVPQGNDYVQDSVRAGNKVRFDHGALRTVLGISTGTLPTGEAAFTRILQPLGYHVNGIYPLQRISMTGRAYAHEDDAEEIAQFFLSELHPHHFSSEFQATVNKVLSTSQDPVDAHSAQLLQQLGASKTLPVTDALALLPVLVACFDRQHDLPTIAEYRILLAESAEMAWISTEGNAFNHATDRVPNVEQVADAQRALGRAIKEKIEVSRNGRVRQTAFRASTVTRLMRDENGMMVEMKVPGSFYEFISRDRYLDEDTRREKLDLTFDSGNAQGIFKMTASADAASC
ncbi:DUF1338 domain-containing protein [Collimonas antrihumi]|uniref:DUF1338 domain-containing protein n=1 Tax=Collimonas antrihumi TaxID=1940615 RepID=UPI001B8BDF4A|nr:DUF1338 domain-containing protein [Collimonas antrihumi]